MSGRRLARLASALALISATGCAPSEGGEERSPDAGIAPAPDPADDPERVLGPAGAVLVDWPACPLGYSPLTEAAVVTDPAGYDEADWLCDFLGDRWVTIADGAAMGGRVHDCAIVRPAPAEAERLLCMPGGGAVDLVEVERFDGLAVGETVVDLALAVGDGLCPRGHTPVTVDAARALDAATEGALCALVGEQATRLAPVGDAAIVGCAFESDRNEALERTLCVQLHRAEVGPVLMPDVGDRPAVYEMAVRKPGEAETIGRVFVSLGQAPEGWAAQRMVWAAPEDGGAVWMPDGTSDFDLVPTKRHSEAPAVEGAAFEHQIGAAWKEVYGVDVPGYRLEGLGDSGLKVAGGTLRFMGEVVEDNALPALFDVENSPAPIRFAVNDGSKPLVIIESIYTDARPADD